MLLNEISLNKFLDEYYFLLCFCFSVFISVEIVTLKFVKIYLENKISK